MNTTVVIGGETGLIQRIDGTVVLKSVLDGETAQYIGVEPPLEDEIEVTPSADEQIIVPSDGFVGLRSVKVKSIPNGYGLTKITSFSKQTIALADTDYASWSPSSTATAIIPTANVGTFTATDVADNDYFTRTRIYLDVVYPDGTSTSKGKLTKMVGENWYCITRRASNSTNLNNSTRNANVAESITNYWVLGYYNSGWVASYSQSYGIYPANSAPTLSSTSAASPTVTFNRPIINARTSTTYFSSTYANALDKRKTTITFAYDVYRADATYRRREIQESVIDMWNNGL